MHQKPPLLVSLSLIISAIILVFGLRSCGKLDITMSDQTTNEKLDGCLVVIEYTEDEMPPKLERAMKKAIKSCTHFNVYIAKPESDQGI